MKRVFKFFSYFFFSYSIFQLNRRIKQCLLECNPKKIIDVACGENDMILEFIKEKDIEIIVGNDISWSQLEFLLRKVNKKHYNSSSSFLLFTNHDARKLPFKNKYFDTLICKNVLHHMDNFHSVQTLLNEIARISKNAVVVEILDPFEEGLWGRLRHKYYMNFLKDAGSNFLNREQFNTITNLEKREELFEMKTIRGVYQFAIFKD